VVFLFSDGSYSRWSGEFSTPLEIAKELAGKHDVCFNVISTAMGEAQTALLKNMASINACSRVISFEDFYKNKAYQSGALFVINEEVFTILFTRDKVVGFETKNILFDFDGSGVKTEFDGELDALGKFLKANPGSEVTIVGFTDNTGAAEYNLGLSRRRAETVAEYLMNNFNIDGDRISVFWYGDAFPIAGNDTSEGRRQNRRVVSLVSGLQ
jgi:OOP family OmpA-OmpF porin